MLKKICIIFLVVFLMVCLVYAQKPKVKVGLEVLRDSDFQILKGKKVGLITNATGITSDGKSSIDLLFGAKDVKLVALFGPEHGLRADVDQYVSSSKDEKTGLPVYSLYGKDGTRPSEESLKGIDVLVYDIQDVGVRFYTYITTMAVCMEEAKKAGIEFVVLDRPDMDNGIDVDGCVLDEELRGGFASYYPIPIRHGLTIGELAKLFNDHFKIGCKLEVVKMEGWKREMYYDDTYLPWINPSPNIRNITQVILYPGVALTEAANISVGRGTYAPFEVIGAPYIDGKKLADELNSRKLPGLRFEPISFVPDSTKFRGEKCGGVRIHLEHRDLLDVIPAGMNIVEALYKLYPTEYKIEANDGLIGSKSVPEKIKKGVPLAEIMKEWQPKIDEFKKIREKYLLY